jgi:hypothetical protein
MIFFMNRMKIFKILLLYYVVFFRLKEEAKTALGRKDKKGALNIMRKVARVRKEIQDKDIQYQRLLSILEQLASSKQTKEVANGAFAIIIAMVLLLIPNTYLDNRSVQSGLCCLQGDAGAPGIDAGKGG